MNKYIFIFICALFTLAGYVHGNVVVIEDSLRKDAVAIIQNFDAVFIQSDLNSATYKVKETITVLNEQGKGYADFGTYGDNFRELKDFSGVIRNVSGAVIKKIGKKDLTVSSMSEQMATDSYSIGYECKVPTYPYTVEYTYEQKWKNGIISYPPFAPIARYGEAVVEANYRIELPTSMKLRYTSNADFKIEEKQESGKQVYIFSANNMKPMISEPYSPPGYVLSPRVLIAPANFCFDSQCGDMSDWKNYGLWVSKLLKTRDVLPPLIVSKLQDMVKDVKTDREKVEIIYKYLQDNSRYVSIQLGIGGFQPIEASSVLKTNFGDCKGLSNAMKAMLSAVGISSNYCEISTRERDLYKDFTNVTQTDHAILLVPLKNDSIWLECTSQRLPFGYIHNRIAGHDALVVSDEGGTLCRLPEYADKDNKTITNLVINVGEDGSAKGNLSFSEYLHAYNSNVWYMTSKDRDYVLKYINGNVKFPKIQYSNINVVEQKTESPSCTLTSDFVAGEFANKTGTRMFIPICPLDKSVSNPFSSATRVFDIDIPHGYSESDTIVFNIPELYTLESMPKNVSLTTPFGTFETEVMSEGNKVIYIQRKDIFTGRYDKSEYEAIKDFFTKMINASKQRLVLKKI